MLQKLAILLLATPIFAQMGGVAPGGPAGAQPAANAPPAPGAQIVNVPGQAAPPPAPGAGAAPVAAQPAPAAAPPAAAPPAVSLDSYTVTTVIGGATTVQVLPISATTAYRTTVVNGLLTTQPFQYVQQFPARPTVGADVPAGSIGLGKLSSKGTVGTTKEPVYVTRATIQ
ncbi:hypothetical protein CJU89_5678 [Yarrowia sp. B02]|nr:hypothetical protein CJU89_5678 [Yarrowia sp. B02]